MQETDYLDDNLLGAFVDGQLDQANCEAVIVAMAQDPEVRERVDRLRRAKDLMKLGFASARPRTCSGPLQRPAALRKYTGAVAASVAAVALALAAGSLGYHYGRHLEQAAVPALASAVRQHPDRVVLHINEANPAQFAAALAYSEKFLQQHPTDGRIELIANAGGLNMMRTGLSPYEEEISALLDMHRNIRFIACANGIANLRKQGVEPQIIANIATDKKALDHIVGRLQDGWSYLRMDRLPEI